MTPQTILILTRCNVMLNATWRRYNAALRRLGQAEPGYPAHTPGSGEPGGGKGYTVGSITDRLAMRSHPELEAAQRIVALPDDIYAIVAGFNNEHIHLPLPDLTANPNRNLRLLVWSYLVIARLLDNNIEPRLHALDQLHRTIDDLHQTVNTWGTAATTPVKDPNAHLLPDDLTGLWCRNHLRIGEREPRHRGDLCRFCDDMRRLEGFLPPTELLEQRHRQGRIYDRDVEPWRKAHRDRGKKRRRKTG